MFQESRYARWAGGLTLAVCVGMLAGIAADPARAADGVQIRESGTTLQVEVGGRAFTEYWYRDVPRPYFYPVLGPGGLPMTRNWPMKEAPDEARDHPHHKSLWFTHGAVNGVDFWADGAGKGRIVHREFTTIKSGDAAGVIGTRNDWVGPDGKLVCTEDRTMTIRADGADRMIDFEIVMHASQGDLTFGDTKEGSMAIRLAETMRLKGAVGKGNIVNSEGVRDGQTWGKRAAWCYYYGPVQGKTVGVAVFDHPRNPRHPTWWHVRDYGLFAVNPFGIHDFEKKPAGAGDLKVPAGQSVTFRYRFLFTLGDEKQARVAERYREYAGASAAR